MSSSAKRFEFTIEDLRTHHRTQVAGVHAKLDGAFKLAAAALRLPFTCPGPGLRMFRFQFVNTRTGEASGFLGQGVVVADAWSNAVKGTYETFRPKNDGKWRPSFGVTVLLPPRPGDKDAIGRAVSRPIPSFESDETFAEEQARLAREAAEKKAAEAAAATPAHPKAA